MSRSYTDSLDFTHLEAETDDNADFDSLGNAAAENAIVQPTLIIPPPPQAGRNRRRNERGSSDNPTEAAVLPNISTEEVNHNDVTKSPGEGFEDSFVNGPSISDNTVSSQNQSQRGENGEQVSNEPLPVNSSDISEANGTMSNAPASFKIHYDSSRGNVSVLEGQTVVRPDGSQCINTIGIHDQWEEQHNRPLRKKRMRLIKIFSLIACVFFFPTGIPAIYYAFRTEREFNEGIMMGNIDRAQKFAKRSERLIVLSFVLAFMVGALIVALIERPYFDHRDYHRGTVVG